MTRSVIKINFLLTEVQTTFHGIYNSFNVFMAPFKQVNQSGRILINFEYLNVEFRKFSL